MPRSLVALLLLGVIALGASPAQAGVDPSRGPAYNIDIFYGPVFGSTRIIGMGGAYTAIAEGAEGLLYNPAAVANRYRYSLKWFDYDLGFDYYFFLLGDKTDFDNNRATAYSTYSQFMFFLGPALHFGPLSVSVNWIRQSFALSETPLLSAGSVNLDVVHAAIGYRFFEGALVVGVGARFTSLTVREEVLASLVGTTRPEVGILWRPARWPFRVGIAGRTSATACPPEFRTADGCTPTLESGLQTVVMPWEIEIGVAFSFGPRVFNRPWKNPRSRAKLREKEVAAVREARAAELRNALNAAPVAERARIAREWDVHEKEIRAAEEKVMEAWDDHVAEHDKARLRAEERIHTVISIDLLITGAVDDALGIEAVVTNADRDRSFASPGAPRLSPGDAPVTLSPRLGVESEIWHDRLKVRAGTYLEPARYEGTRTRLHGTAGLEVRLFYFTPPILLPRTGIRAGATGDFASRYINLSVSVGIWH